MQAAENRRIGQRLTAPQAQGQGSLEQRGLIDLGKDLVGGLGGNRAGDAKRLDFANDARAPAVLQADLCVRAGHGGSQVVERSLTAQPRNRGVNRLVVVLPRGQARAHLRFR